jgi:cell wall-associated NlpC family hydrolase
VDRAIAWALSKAGNVNYRKECLPFVQEAYGVFAGEPDGPTLYRKLGEPNKGASAASAPRGALVFFGPSDYRDAAGHVQHNSYGHVGLALGNGQMISANVGPGGPPRVTPIVNGPARNYLGWAAAPSFWPGR